MKNILKQLDFSVRRNAPNMPKSAPTNPDDIRDAQLMRAFVQGDSGALDRLAAIYMPQIARFAYSILQNSEEAGDAVQETFLRLIQSCERYNPDRPFRPWLFTLARRACQDIARRTARRLNKHQHFAENSGQGSGFAAVSVFDSSSDGEANVVAIDPARDIRSALIEQQEVDSVYEMMEKLEPNAREIIILRLIDDMGFAEIAAILDRPLSTITSIYYRNIERLRALLDDTASNQAKGDLKKSSGH